MPREGVLLIECAASIPPRREVAWPRFQMPRHVLAALGRRRVPIESRAKRTVRRRCAADGSPRGRFPLRRQGLPFLSRHGRIGLAVGRGVEHRPQAARGNRGEIDAVIGIQRAGAPRGQRESEGTSLRLIHTSPTRTSFPRKSGMESAACCREYSGATTGPAACRPQDKAADAVSMRSNCLFTMRPVMAVRISDWCLGVGAPQSSESQRDNTPALNQPRSVCHLNVGGITRCWRLRRTASRIPVTNPHSSAGLPSSGAGASFSLAEATRPPSLLPLKRRRGVSTGLSGWSRLPATLQMRQRWPAGNRQTWALSGADTSASGRRFASRRRSPVVTS